MKLGLQKIFENKRAQKTLKIIGNILCVISIIFIIIFFINSDADFSVILQPKILLVILMLGFFVSISIIAFALAWKSNLEMFTSKKMNSIQIASIYTRANLSKYIPGNIMHFISRNILGSELGLNQKDMGVSSIIEVILQVLVILIFVLCLVSDILFDSINLAIKNGQMKLQTLIFIVLGLAAIIIFIAVYAIKKRKTLVLRPKNLLLSSVYYLIFCIINSVAFVIIIFATQDSLNGFNNFTLSGYYMLAWFLGFITPGAPSGLGIREYILLMLLTPVFPKSEVLLLMIIMRIVTILGDLFSFAMLSILSKIIKKRPFLHN